MDPINKTDDNELQKAINNVNGGGASFSAPEPPNFGAPTPGEDHSSGTTNLSKVKSMALSDLRPVLENVDMPAESKFKLYKDIIEVTHDKASIEPAYAAAKAITSSKDRAEALLFIIETIDKLGV